MRPIRLKLEAFGAYVEPLDIDFDVELAGEKFFLIHGVTGSGKTTILDAICFALYGASSGGGRDGTMMRSDYAAPRKETFVEFTFALKNKIYRVRRTPKYDKQKSRGVGLTSVAANADLYCLDGERAELIENGASNVTSRIEKLIGFKCDQFRQVIVLPQGDFKRFLKAGSRERETILTILFKTELYRRVEEQLKARATELKRDYELKVRDQNLYLTEAGATDESELATMLETLAVELRTLETTVEQIKGERDALNGKLNEGQALEKIFAELEEKTAAKISADATVARLQRQLKEAKAEYDRRRAEESERRAIDQRLSELRKVRAKLEELKSAIKKVAEEEDRLSKETATLISCDKKTARYEERLQFLLDEEKRHLTNAGKVEEAQRRLEECRRRDLSAAALEKLRGEVKRAEASVKKLEAERETRRKALDRLRHLSIAGRAAMLAVGLKDGEPCPVCGSTEHPKPAMSDELIPTDDEIERAEKSLRAIENQKLAADKNCAALTAELEVKRQEAARQADLLSTARAQEELDAALKSKSALEDCRQRINKGRAFVEDARKQRDKQQQLVTERAALSAAAKRSVEEKQRTIMEGYSATDEARVFADLDRLKAQLDEMTRAWNDADRKFHKLEKDCAAASERRQSIEERRSELSKQLEGRARPNLEKLRAEAQRSEAAFVEGTKRTTQLSERLKMLVDRREKLTRLSEELRSIEAEYKIWSRLSMLANGSVSFSRYVLHAMFKDIIDEANNRLWVMSGHRYRLIDRKVAKDARRLSGLELEIYDEYTGAKRDVETLSGGEAFLASLALALGLADVVQNHAGGVRLDTIFIDEGFGSLDSETLNMAIRSLMDLQKGGRLVGIISHVEELKQRIPIRLEVVKSRRGSTAMFRRQ